MGWEITHTRCNGVVGQGLMRGRRASGNRSGIMAGGDCIKTPLRKPAGTGWVKKNILPAAPDQTGAEPERLLAIPGEVLFPVFLLCNRVKER